MVLLKILNSKYIRETGVDGNGTSIENLSKRTSNEIELRFAYKKSVVSAKNSAEFSNAHECFELSHIPLVISRKLYGVFVARAIMFLFCRRFCKSKFSTLYVLARTVEIRKPSRTFHDVFSSTEKSFTQQTACPRRDISHNDLPTINTTRSL